MKEGAHVNDWAQLLYKVSTVFPTPDLLRASGPSGSYTLPPGSHVYPFNFKVWHSYLTVRLLGTLLMEV